MVDDLWSAAIQEAIASNPPDNIILPTIELRHPNFRNGAGQLEYPMIVADTGFDIGREDGSYGHKLKIPLENSLGEYLLDANGNVRMRSYDFLACMFEFHLPEQNTTSLPEVELTIDNVAPILIEHLDAAVTIRADIQLIYREFILGINEPQYTLRGLILKRVNSSISQVTATASFADLMGSSFPKKLYRAKEYKSLSV